MKQAEHRPTGRKRNERVARKKSPAAVGWEGDSGQSGSAAQVLRIGARLRHARLLQGYSLRQVATEAGVSESYVSKLENDKVRPSLSTLHRLANTLNTNIGALVDENRVADGPVTVVTPDKRSALLVADDGADNSITLQKLVPSTSGSLLQVNIHVIPAAAEEDFIKHTGQEFGFVLEGELELRVEGRIYRIAAGDAFSFESDRPHGYYNPGDRVARVLWVNTPPTF